MKRTVAILTGLVVATAVSCSSGGVIVGLSPLCEEPDQATRVSCEEAVLVAQAVALSHHVTTEGPRAEVKPEAVAKGRSVPAWWVTFRPVPPTVRRFLRSAELRGHRGCGDGATPRL